MEEKKRWHSSLIFVLNTKKTVSRSKNNKINYYWYGTNMMTFWMYYYYYYIQCNKVITTIGTLSTQWTRMRRRNHFQGRVHSLISVCLLSALPDTTYLIRYTFIRATEINQFNSFLFVHETETVHYTWINCVYCVRIATIIENQLL